ncbi:MAG: transposase [Methylovirgula sp.]
MSLILLCGMRGSRGAGPEPVVRTLSAFVTALVNGFVRDAVLAGPPQNELAFIAEHAGCSVVEAGTEIDALREALRLARGTDLLILYAGHVPEFGAIEAVGDIVASGQSAQHGWLLRAAPAGPLQQIFPGLAPPVGLIAARTLCDEAAVPSFANLVKATRARSAPRLRLRRIA